MALSSQKTHPTWCASVTAFSAPIARSPLVVRYFRLGRQMRNGALQALQAGSEAMSISETKGIDAEFRVGFFRSSDDARDERRRGYICSAVYAAVRLLLARNRRIGHPSTSNLTPWAIQALGRNGAAVELAREGDGDSHELPSCAKR
jgi:hypothetical protein